ncbi:MAG: hypothetical protein AAFR04_05655 [Pseudomonadota bacterium]
MATIIDFPLRVKASVDEASSRMVSEGSSPGEASVSERAATAQIMIFPGVRVERWHDDEPPVEAASTRKLEMAD